MSNVESVQSVVSRDGTQIAYEQSGAGPALILIGGAFGERTTAAGLAALLAPRFTVFAYDRRGRGGSGDTPTYAVEREVEDLEALIDRAGGAAFVYGHSSGAALAIEASAEGLPIGRLVLYEPPYIVDHSRTPMSRRSGKWPCKCLLRRSPMLARLRSGLTWKASPIPCPTTRRS